MCTQLYICIFYNFKVWSHAAHLENESIPSSAAHSGRWRWTSPAGSWRWWTGRPWPPCSRWHTSGQRPKSGPAGTARQWPQSPMIWKVNKQPILQSVSRSKRRNCANTIFYENKWRYGWFKTVTVVCATTEWKRNPKWVSIYNKSIQGII